ncbi:MAG: type II toxin-antitoxin system PemK/MazF family toxin [Verrucomicrobiota bacterium]|nr:type II toxin-antitoxin system PemK/MazF family toxin [Verrucomicrobiota bacterium]
MARQVARGEVWMIDLGMAAKVRPCLILSVAFRDDEKAVVTYVARSTERRGGRFEVEHIAPHFLPGVFDAQNLGTVPVSKLERFLTRLPADKLAAVETAVQRWLGFIANDDAAQ